MKNIIIRTPNYIGDTINCTPAIELLKQEYPDAGITIVGPHFVEDLFKHDPRITKRITFDRHHKHPLALLNNIRKKKYDLGVIFINTFWSALLFKLCRIRTIIGYDNEGRGFLMHFKPKIVRNLHYINQYAILVNSFLEKKYTYLPPLTLSYTKKQTFNFDNNQKTIGLYLGGPNKVHRRYPDEMAIELIKSLTTYNIVLIGDKNDNISHAAYEQAVHHPNILNLTGKTTVEEYINTIANLDLLITIDSSAMHIAAAVKTPFIALMGLSTNQFSAIAPKVNFGTILKIEENMIQEENYIYNITREIITEAISSKLPPN